MKTSAHDRTVAGRDEPRFFTVAEANATLPLVKAIASDLARLSRDVTERRERLSMLMGGRDREAHDLYSEELAQIEDELERDGEQLQEYVEELRQLGVEPKNGPEGLVDFPTVIDGRPAYLCWKLGEAEILYWHDLDAGFAGRQSLAAASLADGPMADAAESGPSSRFDA